MGMNPTFGERKLSVEAHVFDFHRDIYGSEMQVTFIERIREEKHFETPAGFVRQIEKDMNRVKQILKKHPRKVG